MTEMQLGNILLYAGVGVMALAVIAFAAAWLCFRSKKKKLWKDLESEYGKNNGRGGK